MAENENDYAGSDLLDEQIVTPTSILDSRTSQLSDLLIAKLEHAFHKQTSQVILHDLAKIAIEYDPIDLAHAVTRLPLSTRHIVFENLPDLDAKMTFMVNLTSNTRTAILRQLHDDEIKQLVEKMASDDAVTVLEDLSDRRLRRIIGLLETKKANRIRELLKHGRFSAGRLMSNEFFAFPMNTTIGKVASQIRDNPGIELTHSIFVLSDEEELIGFVPERNLIVNNSNMLLRQVMRPILHKVRPDATRDEIVDLVERYKIAALPVVDPENRLLGVVTYEDVVEMMEDIADETIASIAGTAESVSEHEPIMRRFIARAPWLLVTVLAGLITATGMAHFHDQPWFLVVPFFVPLITGMSGNVGIQCSTILVRGIATGEVSQRTKREAVLRELAIGHMIGAFFGVLCGVVVYILNRYGIHQTSFEPLTVGLTVMAGVMGACLTATFLGTSSPLIFARFRIDPAVASGPIVTACNDVLSTFMFFFVAKVMSSLV